MSPSVRDTLGLVCPSCGSDAHLQIMVSLWADLDDAGPNPGDHYEWDDRSACRCSECLFDAEVRIFRVPPEPSLLKSFEIRFSETDTYATTVQALDEETALSIGRALLDLNGPNTPFDVVRNERSEMDVWEVQS
ncbi:MAG: hypothetical protein R3D68_07295 [Hyphomicrobiaceae bacterium]